MSLLEEVENLLTSNDVSNIFIGDLPKTPDIVVCLFGTGGSDRSLSGTQVEEPTFQVRIRDTVYANGESRCNTIKDILHGYIGGSFLLIAQQGDIIPIGRDENGRPEFTINFRTYFRRG